MACSVYFDPDIHEISRKSTIKFLSIDVLDKQVMNLHPALSNDNKTARQYTSFPLNMPIENAVYNGKPLQIQSVPFKISKLNDKLQKDENIFKIAHASNLSYFQKSNFDKYLILINF